MKFPLFHVSIFIDIALVTVFLETVPLTSWMLCNMLPLDGGSNSWEGGGSCGLEFPFSLCISLRLGFWKLCGTCHFNSEGAAVLLDKLIERDSLNKRSSV